MAENKIEKSEKSDNPKEEKKAVEKKVITKDMTLGEVVRKYPAAAGVMMEYGLHCIGCHVAEWETVEQGCQGHGLSSEEIDKMLKELNSEKILAGNLVADDDEKDNKEKQAEKEKKGFFSRLHK